MESFSHIWLIFHSHWHWSFRFWSELHFLLSNLHLHLHDICFVKVFDSFIPFKLGQNEKNVSYKHFLIIVSLYVFFNKHVIMYLLHNKNYLCKKIIQRKKQVGKQELIVLNAFSKRVKILLVLFTKKTVKPV